MKVRTPASRVAIPGTASGERRRVPRLSEFVHPAILQDLSEFAVWMIERWWLSPQQIAFAHVQPLLVARAADSLRSRQREAGPTEGGAS